MDPIEFCGRIFGQIAHRKSPIPPPSPILFPSSSVCISLSRCHGEVFCCQMFNLWPIPLKMRLWTGRQWTQEWSSQAPSCSFYSNRVGYPAQQMAAHSFLCIDKDKYRKQSFLLSFEYATTPILSCLFFLQVFFAGIECFGHSFAHVAHL